jgi:Protein of unknown function, DUF547
MTNFEPWDRLLHQYVDDQGRVDYANWKKQQPRAIEQWIQDLETETNLSHLNRNEALSLWINLYNALTISAILKRYPIASIQPKIFGIPNWLAFLSFFLLPVHSFAGKHYSLNQIEHNILRRQFQESRIHFAIVCASIGCPLLRNQAYKPALVHQQLEQDANRFINNPDKLRYDLQSGILYCSKIFKWYREDFLQDAPSIPDYIRSYLNTNVPINADTPIVYLDYDWNLNQQSALT